MMIGSLLALLAIVVFSLLIVRVGATALMMTGLSGDSASFQAYSAFFGVGFTTSEAEHVVNHPVRRRIIRDLILLGNIGLTSILATVIFTFIEARSGVELFGTVAAVLLGALSLALLGKVGIFKRLLDWGIRKGLNRVGSLRVADYDLLLRAKAGFCVSELEVLPESALVGSELGESRPADQGVIVLGITKDDGRFVGAPQRHERVDAGDVLLVYGQDGALRRFRRWSDSNKAAPDEAAETSGDTD